MRKGQRTKTEVEVVDIEEEDEGNVFDTEDEEEEEIKPKQINEADVELVQYSDDEEEADDKNEVIDKVLEADKGKGSGTEQEDNDVIQVDEAMFKVLEADKESGGVSTDQDEDVVQVGETANSSYWNIQARILRIKKGIRKQTNGERREDKRKNKSKSNMIDEVIIDDDDEEEEEEEKEMEMQCLDEKLISVKTQRVPLKKQRAWRQPRYEHTLICLFFFPFVCLFVCSDKSYFQIPTRCSSHLFLEQATEETRHAQDQGRHDAGDGQDQGHGDAGEGQEQGLGEGERSWESLQEAKSK